MKAKKDRTLHRIKIIQGQLRGVGQMIENDKYCIDILTQSLAIQNALKELDKIILEDHIKECVVNHIKTGKTTKATKELIDIFGLARKN